VFKRDGVVDSAAPATIRAANMAGYLPTQIGVYLFPQPLKNGVIQDGGAQLKKAVDFLTSAGVRNLISSIWLDIEGGTHFWSTNTALNVQFFESLRAQARGYAASGLSVGIYTSRSQWAPIVGPTYNGGADFPVWYAQYNSNQNFNDWVPFAGWQVPLIHQYKGTTMQCGASVDLNVMPDTWGSLSGAMKNYAVNGGTFRQPSAPQPQPKPPGPNGCAAARGSCINVRTTKCAGTFRAGLCPGGVTLQCCIPIATLQAIAPVPKVGRMPFPVYPHARSVLPPSTHGRILVEAQDTGKVSWIKDDRKPFKKMTMGKLNKRNKRKQNKRS